DANSRRNVLYNENLVRRYSPYWPKEARGRCSGVRSRCVPNRCIERLLIGLAGRRRVGGGRQSGEQAAHTNYRSQAEAVEHYSLLLPNMEDGRAIHAASVQSANQKRDFEMQFHFLLLTCSSFVRSNRLISSRARIVAEINHWAEVFF